MIVNRPEVAVAALTLYHGFCAFVGKMPAPVQGGPGFLGSVWYPPIYSALQSIAGNYDKASPAKPVAGSQG